MAAVNYPQSVTYLGLKQDLSKQQNAVNPPTSGSKQHMAMLDRVLKDPTFPLSQPRQDEDSAPMVLAEDYLPSLPHADSVFPEGTMTNQQPSRMHSPIPNGFSLPGPSMALHPASKSPAPDGVCDALTQWFPQMVTSLDKMNTSIQHIGSLFQELVQSQPVQQQQQPATSSTHKEDTTTTITAAEEKRRAKAAATAAAEESAKRAKEEEAKYKKAHDQWKKTLDDLTTAASQGRHLVLAAQSDMLNTNVTDDTKDVIAKKEAYRILFARVNAHKNTEPKNPNKPPEDSKKRKAKEESTPSVTKKVVDVDPPVVKKQKKRQPKTEEEIAAKKRAQMDRKNAQRAVKRRSEKIDKETTDMEKTVESIDKVIKKVKHTAKGSKFVDDEASEASTSGSDDDNDDDSSVQTSSASDVSAPPRPTTKPSAKVKAMLAVKVNGKKTSASSGEGRPKLKKSIVETDSEDSDAGYSETA